MKLLQLLKEMKIRNPKPYIINPDYIQDLDKSFKELYNEYGELMAELLYWLKHFPKTSFDDKQFYEILHKIGLSYNNGMELKFIDFYRPLYLKHNIIIDS